MARRTSEEILAQRDAWMARKAAREAGEDIPIQPPLYPGQTAPEPVAAPVAEPVPEPVAAQATPEPETAPQSAPTAQPEPQPEAAPPPAVDKVGPMRPAKRRTPEEILAQREAWMARKAAREAGQVPPPPPPEPTPAPTPVAAPVAQAKSAAPAAAAPAKPAAAPKRAAKAAPAPEVDPNVSRREFLNYAWLASIALFSLETVGLSLWFAFPNAKEGEFGGRFPIGPAVDVLPEVNSDPVPFTDGKFWLVNLDTEVDGEPRKGVLAIYKVCTHLGCLYEWVPMTFRFECPCHGSKFQLTGDYIAGPARRSLDSFVIEAYLPDG